MKNTRKKKKRSSAPKATCKGVVGSKDDGTVGRGGFEAEDEQKVLEMLVGSISLSSPEESALAYKDAEADLDKSAQIPMGSFVDNVKDSSTCSSSSGFSGLDLASTSGSSEGFMESNYTDMRSANGFRRGKQKKKVSAAMGTVSTVLGKDYMRRNSTRPSGYHNNKAVEKAEVEQFLCSMLGNNCDISLAVVRDVLCQCGYSVDKALGVLLEMSMPSHQQSENHRHPDGATDNIDDVGFPAYHDNLVDGRSECTSFSSEGEFSDDLWSLGSFHRNYAEVLSGSNSKAKYDNSFGNLKSDLPQKVLESLFDIHKSTEHDKDVMNWRNVAKKMRSLAPQFNASSGVAESQQHSYAKGDDYYVFREDAKQHWDSMRSYYQKATAAYTKKDRAHAAYLSDQGKEQRNLAQKADAKASHDIFMSRNKDIENVITIDLHGQHVKPAMRMLKLHLLFGSFVPSVQTLRVITGCGSHGVGKSKLKQSVVKLLEKENIEWHEENRGTVVVKLSGSREFSFLDSDTDSDCN